MSEFIYLSLRHLAVKKFNANVRARILIKIRKMRFGFLIGMFIKKLTRYFKKERPTIMLRNRQRLKQSLNVFARFKIESYQERASDKVEKFLFKTGLISQVNTQVSSTMAAFMYIQLAWRRHRDCLRNRKVCVSERFFEDQKGTMSNHFIKKKSLQTGMFKSVIQKMMHCETTIKKRILDLYMAR